MDMKFIVSSEDPNTVYLCFPDIRLIFRNNEYVGWYIPGNPGNEGE